MEEHFFQSRGKRVLCYVLGTVIIVAHLILMPIAVWAAARAATCAAKGVPFLEPLKPILPELAQAMTFPYLSVTVMMVLLNVDWI